MRRMLLVAAALAATAPAVGQTSDAEKEIVALVKEFDAAFVKNDTTFMERILADDWMAITPDGEVMTKAQMQKGMKEGDLKFGALEELEAIKVRVYGDAVVATGRGRMKATLKGKPYSSHDRWTNVYIKRDGKWQCVSSHTTRLAAESEGKKP